MFSSHSLVDEMGIIQQKSLICHVLQLVHSLIKYFFHAKKADEAQSDYFNELRLGCIEIEISDSAFGSSGVGRSELFKRGDFGAVDQELLWEVTEFNEFSFC